MSKIDKEMSNYIHLSKYSRWLDKEGRRETWEETVNRSKDFWIDEVPDIANDKQFTGAWGDVMDQKVTPSMRVLMTAGEALHKDNAAGYNCWGKSIDHVRVFDEIFYLLMCGGGVGFSVESEHINKLPEVPDVLHKTDTVIAVPDTRIGWATAFKQLLAMLYSGDLPTWDLSRIRPAGARLKCFGGRASGPGPLNSLFNYTVYLFKKAQGRKLTTLECHDLQCKVADTVIMGSVRRSACISVSNLNDDKMRRAKMGEWWDVNPQRALANNSVGYTEKPDMESYTKELRSIYRSKAGERGIINKEALRAKAISCGREDYLGGYILNPCGEAILRDTGQACNLTEVVARPEDTLEDLKRKVSSAAIIGTLQSTLTNFRYIRKIWRDNIEEERLLGISITGIMDHPVLSGMVKPSNAWGDYKKGENSLASVLKELKEVARETNRVWAAKLGVPTSKQLTLIKPSGTVSQLCGTASGIHPRFAPFYIRRVTQDENDPLTRMMVDQKVPHVINMKGQYLFEFPIKAPENSVVQRDMGAMAQLELWKIYQEFWCDGNPSQTIYYTDKDFLKVQEWVWTNWDIVGGLSFFPVDDNVYENPPNEEIDEETYLSLVDKFPEIDWESLKGYESDDNTTGSQELACSGGACEI